MSPSLEALRPWAWAPRGDDNHTDAITLFGTMIQRPSSVLQFGNHPGDSDNAEGQRAEDMAGVQNIV